MKIGIDARMYGGKFTGIGRYTAELINNLSKMNNSHEFVLFMRKDAYDKFKIPNSRFRKVLSDYHHYSFGEQFGFLKQLNNEKLDLMHFTHFNAPIFYSCPFIVTIHDLTLSFFPGKKMTNPIYRIAYHLVIRFVTRKAKMIIAVSQHTKKDLVSVLKISAKKIIVIYNGVSRKFTDTTSVSRDDLITTLNLKKPYLLYTGVWRDHKNLVGMIKAFSYFNKDANGEYELVITGLHNPSYHEVPDIISALNLEKSVHLTGLVSESDLFALYKNALAYVFPSFYEGFGLPPLEAMQCGIPVLASNASAVPEICGKDNALFFDPYDIDDMKRAMQSIASNHSLRHNLIDRGYKRVKEFCWKKMTGQVLDVYNSII